MLTEKSTGGWPVNTVFITPVERKSVQGRSDYSYLDSTGNLIPMKRSFSKGAGKKYNFPAHIDGRSIKSDLSRSVINKWYQQDPHNLDLHLKVGPQWENRMETVVSKERISKQMELEIRFDLAPGTLTNERKLHYNLKLRKAGDIPNMLESFNITLYDDSNRFTDETLRGALAIELARVSGKIASTKGDVNPSRHDFFISQENEAAIEAVAKQEIINNAITDLTLMRRKQTPFFRYSIATILKLVKGTVSDVIVKQQFDKFITDKSKGQLDNIEKFNKIVALIDEGEQGLNRLHIMYLIQQAVNTHLMSVKSGNYIWHSKKGIDNLYNLGSKYSAVVQLFQTEFDKYDPEEEGENWYASLIEELQTKSVKIEE